MYLYHTVNLSKTTTLKKTKNWFLRLIIAICRSKVLQNAPLMQVESIAECSKGSILQYFRPSLSYHLSLRPLFCLFLSGRFTQVLLYIYYSQYFWCHRLVCDCGISWSYLLVYCFRQQLHVVESDTKTSA